MTDDYDEEEMIRSINEDSGLFCEYCGTEVTWEELDRFGECCKYCAYR